MRKLQITTLYIPIVKWIVAFILFSLFTVSTIYVTCYFLGPPDLTNEQNTVYYGEEGNKIGEEKGNENRHWISFDEMSPHVIDATLAIEDQRFYEHHGFDFKRIIGAVVRDIKSRSLKEGASTLTQQYARTLYLSSEKTWKRKIKEALYTVRLEMFYSKEELLEGYLNSIYYGHGAYGVEAASELYFNKHAKDLTLAESALLAGIPKGPTYYSPFNDLKRSEKRQQLILREMFQENYITKQQYEIAKNETLVFAEKEQQKQEDSFGSYFKDVVLREAAHVLDLDREAVQSGGFKIYTTMDVTAQQQLEKTVADTFREDSDMNIGALAMDPQSGEMKALIGGRDFKKSMFNRAIDAKRLAGSTFKPFLYYAALDNGYTANVKLMSKPTVFKLDHQEVYQPRNYNGYYAYEPITMAQALALSDNIYAVKTNLYFGPNTLVKTAKEFGITSPLPAVPSLALGTAAVSVKEMVSGYALLANGGESVVGHAIKRIENRNGTTIYSWKDEHRKEVLDPKKAFILTELMTGMFDESLNGYMNVTGSTIADKLTRTYAGKSGSTASDSWMIGYTPELVTGVWTGYDDNRTLEVIAEQSYAKEVWADFMEAFHQDKKDSEFIPPRGVIGIPIDLETGQRATPDCPNRRVMYFEIGTEPLTYCDAHSHQPYEEKQDDKGLFQRWFEMFFD